MVKFRRLQHDLIKSTMGIQFWVEHSSLQDISTELRDMQNKIEVEFKHQLSELEKVKRDVGCHETELKKLRSDHQKLLNDLNEKESKIKELSFIDLDLPGSNVDNKEEET